MVCRYCVCFVKRWLRCLTCIVSKASGVLRVSCSACNAMESFAPNLVTVGCMQIADEIERRRVSISPAGSRPEAARAWFLSGLGHGGLVQPRRPERRAGAAPCRAAARQPMPASAKERLLLCKPLPCSREAAASIFPLIWCSESLPSRVSSSPLRLQALCHYSAPAERVLSPTDT